MSDTRKEYIPPEAEVILLAPAEKLSAWDWSFGNIAWENTGYHRGSEGIPSAVVVQNTWTEDGFTFERTTPTE